MPEESEFKDRFGKIIVSATYIERLREDEGEWGEIEARFDADEVVDKIHFSEIDELEFQPESYSPLILIRTSEGWKRLPLETGEQALEIFRRLRYRYQAYLQNH